MTYKRDTTFVDESKDFYVKTSGQSSCRRAERSWLVGVRRRERLRLDEKCLLRSSLHQYISNQQPIVPTTTVSSGDIHAHRRAVIVRTHCFLNWDAFILDWDSWFFIRWVLIAICNKITEQVIVKCPGFRGKGTNIKTSVHFIAQVGVWTYTQASRLMHELLKGCVQIGIIMGHLHNDIILLLHPELFRVLLSCAN